MRRAVAIQMIINKELGLNFCENPWQGSFNVNELTGSLPLFDLPPARGTAGVNAT